MGNDELSLDLFLASGTIAVENRREIQEEDNERAVGCCYADDACARVAIREPVGCCSANVNCESEHDLSCRNVDYNGYLNN